MTSKRVDWDRSDTLLLWQMRICMVALVIHLGVADLWAGIFAAGAGSPFVYFIGRAAR